jgi:DNA-binding response OmpR family regulator
MARKILVVDDSEVVLGVAKAMLEEAGYEVETSHRATGSVALILQTKPDLVLLDVNMPSLRGDMIARMSVATNNSTGTIVVLHSTLPEKELERLAAESGAHGYIKKTGNAHQFVRQVRQFLDAAPQRDNKRPSKSADVQQERLPSSGKQAKRKTVLLVDRDMNALSDLRKLTQSFGYEASFALSFQQASSKLQSDSPDVVILSDTLPDIDRFLLSLSSDYGERLLILCDDSSSMRIPPSARALKRPIPQQVLRNTLAQLTAGSTVSTG